MTDGRAQTVQRSFALDGRRAIPAVGVQAAGSGGPHVGQRTLFDAASSLVPHGQLNRTPVSWTLVARPVRSQAVLSGSSGLRVGFVPDVPGIYQVQVTVGSGVQAGTTTLAVAATYPDPLVPLNSMDTSTNPPASWSVISGSRRVGTSRSLCYSG